MPITPFHFGVGAAVHAIAPRRISFIAFCASNVLIDIEPLYFMLTDNPPLHRFFHTYIGALLVTLFTLGLFMVLRGFARRFWLPNLLNWQSLPLWAVMNGALLGTLSHIVLDSFMHRDIHPFAPFSLQNSLWGTVDLGNLHWFCIITGIMGAGIAAWRVDQRTRG